MVGLGVREVVGVRGGRGADKNFAEEQKLLRAWCISQITRNAIPLIRPRSSSSNASEGSNSPAEARRDPETALET